jgi:hypothetical protein
MEEGTSHVKLKIEKHLVNEIVIDDLLLTVPEFDLLLEYLAWLRRSNFSSFEATRYKHGESTYIDTTISDRERHPLFQFSNFDK